ncbi:hypothetical protein BDE02_05G005300 [Populus trichocarpa]|nr:hypothetical protein BDE02_05G005300 [Populus trichocarpa]
MHLENTSEAKVLSLFFLSSSICFGDFSCIFIQPRYKITENMSF